VEEQPVQVNEEEVVKPKDPEALLERDLSPFVPLYMRGKRDPYKKLYKLNPVE